MSNPERKNNMLDLRDFPKIIKTIRLVIKVINADEVNAKMILSIINANRDYLEAFQGHFEYIRSQEDVKRNLEHYQSQIEKNQGMLFGIYKDDKLIGRIRFYDIDTVAKSCEIGYWLIQSANGHGYMTEALGALEKELIKFGFKKLILDIDDGNIRSENLAKHNGYILEKRLPMASWAKCTGKCDSLIYVKRLI